MKKHLSVLFGGLLLSVASFAQINLADFSAGVAGNYTMYRGTLSQSAPGVKVEVNYGLYERIGITAGFTKAFTIKEASSITASNGMGETKEIESDIKLKFSTISLGTRYRVVGSGESAFQGYIPVGVSYVMAKYEEVAKQDIPAGYTAVNQMEAGKVSGFTMNIGLGAQYTVGTPVVFFEAGAAVPANQMNNTFIDNPIPFQISFNLGVKFPFGSRGE